MMRALVALLVCLIAVPAAAARIKDISTLRDARDSQLVGYGLVVGLSGTGDTFRNTPFTQQAVQGMLQNLGMDVHGIAAAQPQCRGGHRLDRPSGRSAGWLTRSTSQSRPLATLPR